MASVTVDSRPRAIPRPALDKSLPPPPPDASISDSEGSYISANEPEDGDRIAPLARGFPELAKASAGSRGSFLNVTDSEESDTDDATVARESNDFEGADTQTQRGSIVTNGIEPGKGMYAAGGSIQGHFGQSAEGESHPSDTGIKMEFTSPTHDSGFASACHRPGSVAGAGPESPQDFHSVLAFSPPMEIAPLSPQALRRTSTIRTPEHVNGTALRGRMDFSRGQPSLVEEPMSKTQSAPSRSSAHIAPGHATLEGTAARSPAQPSPSRSVGLFLNDLPDPATFPLPPSTLAGSGPVSPAGSASRYITPNLHHSYFSDVSARYSNSTRASMWTEQSQTSYCATSPDGIRSSINSEYSLKENFLEQDSDHEAPTASSPTSDKQLSDDLMVGLGITSDDEHESVRRSKAAAVIPDTGPSPISGPFAHHRQPSWTRKTDLSPLSLAPLSSTSNARPTLPRTHSDLSHVIVPRSPSRSSARSPVLPPGAIPVRTGSRGRCKSDTARSHRSQGSKSSTSSNFSHASKNSNAGISSTQDELEKLRRNLLARAPSPSSVGGDAFGFSSELLKGNLRSSSLKKASSMSKGSKSHSPSSGHRSQASSSSLNAVYSALDPAVKRNGSLRDVPVEQDEDARSVETKTARSAAAVSNNNQRRQTNGSTTSTSESSSANSGSNDSVYANEAFKYSGGIDEEIAQYAAASEYALSGDSGYQASNDEGEPNAVRVADEGKGTVVEANGRPLSTLQDDVVTGTTHLILAGCADPKLSAFLNGILPMLSQTLLVLDISSTNLEEIPEAIGSCTALEELNISSNPISPATLPRSLGELAALRVLVADDAGLSSLPIDLLGLHELKTLSIRRNNLSHLPSWLHHLTKLERLCIEDNPLQGPWKKILAPLLPQAPPITAVPRTPSGLGLPFSPERSAFPMATYISTPSILSPTSSFGATTATTVTPVDSLASPGVLRHHPSAVSSPAEAPISPTMRRMRSTNDLSSPTAGDRIGLTRSPASFSTLQEGSGNTTSSPPKEQDADGVLERLRRAALIEPENYSDSTHSHSRSSHRTRRPGTADGQSLRRPTTADANAGSKWGFIRKMGRKSSSNKMAALAKDQAAAEDLDASMNAAHRLPRQHKAQEIDEKPLRSQEKAPNSAFVPPPSMKPVLESPIMLAPLSPNLERPATNRMSKRKSFLPLELASAPPLLGKVVEDDSAEHSRRLRALMHYMRDLDDLGPSHGSKPGTPPVVDSRPQSRGGTVRGIRDQPSLETLSAAIRNLQMTRDASSASLDSSVLSTLSNTSGGSGAGNDVSTMPESPQAETTQSGPGLKYKDDATRRRRIIAEIVQTEETYIRGLSELIDIYVRPATMPVDGGSGPPVVPPVEHKTVFGNVEGLLQFHAGAFLPSLKTATAPLLQRDAVHGDADEAEETALTASVAEEVAGVFTHHAAFFRMYSAYVNNCDAAQTRISQWLTPSANTAAAALKSATSGSGGSSAHAEASGGLTAGQKKKLKQYIKRCRLHPKHSQLTLESYLLLPVQRIPRYRLLLEDLVRSTPPTRLREPESLSLALEHISNIASSVNESKRQSEQDRKLLGWQTRIRGRWPSPLVQPHRRLIKDGTLVLKRVVKRTPAFLSQNAQNGEDVAQDGASATVGSVIQVDCLQQQSMDKPVNILLCNDITVVVTNPPHARDEHPTVDLYAVLRVQAAKPAQVMGGSNLRVVDAKNILYFAAKSPAEAEEWRDAINSQNQE